MSSASWWSKGKRLVAFASTSCLLLVALAVYTQRTIEKLGRSQDLSVNSLAVKVRLAGFLDQSVERIRADERGIFLSAYSHNTAFGKQAKQNYRSSLAKSKRTLDEMRSLSDGPSEDRLIEALQKDLDSFEAAVGSVEHLCARRADGSRREGPG